MKSITLQHDKQITISTGQSRKAQTWKQEDVMLSEFAGRVSDYFRGSETHDDFMRMTKDKQSDLKDVGGFVGGKLKDGKRLKCSVLSRSMLTLDADTPAADFLDKVRALNVFTLIYCTRKSAPGAERYRVLIITDRDMTPDESVAVGRKIGEKIGLNSLDDTTFDVNRLMFWPSCSRDAEPYFECIDKDYLPVDATLAEYDDWTDPTTWPYSSRSQARKSSAKGLKQQDPRAKHGPVGDFCRAYTIQDAIEKYIPDVYLQTGDPNRYTYAYGSTAGGLVIYDDKFAYSHHGTDPAGGKLLNAYDLIRIHLFDPDGSEMEGKIMPNSRTSSEARMNDLVNNDDRVKIARVQARQAANERRQESQDNVIAFDPLAAKKDKGKQQPEWAKNLDFTAWGDIERSKANAIMILNNDISLKDKIWLNCFTGYVDVTGTLPWPRTKGSHWGDYDDDLLSDYFSEAYGFEPTMQQQKAALSSILMHHQMDPVADYLNGLSGKWDLQPRVETFLIDYLGAEDNIYTRAATRKFLCGAVARALNPGIKFDTMLVLVGEQGIGKSTIFRLLAGDAWFSDALNMTDTADKTAAEKLTAWVMEVPEMQGAKKADANRMKAFISQTVDKYRAAYARQVTEIPRRCVFVGTTNELNGYLRDATGGRRYWPILCSGNGTHTPWDIDADTRDQIWAEAMTYWMTDDGLDDRGLLLPPEAEEIAKQMQREALYQDDREGMLEDYLDIMLPAGWTTIPLEEKLDYIRDPKLKNGDTGHRRDRVSVAECAVECFGDFVKKPDKQLRADIRLMLARLGWKPDGRSHKMAGYGKPRTFARPGAEL